MMLVMILPYLLRKANGMFFKNNKSITKLSKFFRSIHRPVGVLLLVIAPIHSYLIFGGFRLHSGSILYLSMIVTSALGMYFAVKKKKKALTLHRLSVLCIAFFLFLHIFFPSYLYYILK